MKYLVLISLFMSFFCPLTEAQEIRYLARSPRALLMGDAYTSIADDEYTLFYNPASLGKHRGLSITPLNGTLSITNAFGDLDKFETFESTNANSTNPSAIAETLIGFPIHVQGAGYPTLKMGTFGFTLFGNFAVDAILRNKTHPVLDIDYFVDRGFAFGFALNIAGSGRPGQDRWSPDGNRNRQKMAQGKRTSIGFGVKHFNRYGLQGRFDLFGTRLLDIINQTNKDFHAIRKQLGFAKGDTWGADFGIEHSIYTNNSELNMALSFSDIGDTRFKLDEGSQELPPVKMKINAGASFKQDFGFLDYTLSLDFHPLNYPVEWQRKLHVGAELGLPFVKALVGWNGGYFSYGAYTNLWLFKIYAGFYGIELGGNYKEQQGKRALLYFSLLDFSFDA